MSTLRPNKVWVSVRNGVLIHAVAERPDDLTLIVIEHNDDEPDDYYPFPIESSADLDLPEVGDE